MRRVIVQRLTRDGDDDQGKLGRLVTPGFACWTLELPQRGNANGLSCIPAGVFLARWTPSPRLRRRTYEIVGVPGRSGIRIHGGNFAGDRALGLESHSLGCPLLGLDAGAIKGQRAVMRSRAAVEAFERHMGREDFLLEVKDA